MARKKPFLGGSRDCVSFRRERVGKSGSQVCLFSVCLSFANKQLPPESEAARYGALLATTPMLATVSPFLIEGTAQTYRTTPLDGARASQTVLPNRSVT